MVWVVERRLIGSVGLETQPQPLIPIALGIERGKTESLQLTTAWMRPIAPAMAARIIWYLPSRLTLLSSCTQFFVLSSLFFVPFAMGHRFEMTQPPQASKVQRTKYKEKKPKTQD